jgi:hypothetical protein
VVIATKVPKVVTVIPSRVPEVGADDGDDATWTALRTL